MSAALPPQPKEKPAPRPDEILAGLTITEHPPTTEMETGAGQIQIRQWNRVLSVAFSPDGKLLASANEVTKTTARITETGALLPPDGEPDIGPPIQHTERTVKVWEVQAAELVLKLSMRMHEPTEAVAFSPDGTMLVTGHGNGTITLWEALTGKEIRSWWEHRGWASLLTFAPDGARLAISSAGIRVRELDSGRGWTLAGPWMGRAQSMVFSPDSKLLASADDSGLVVLWDIDRGEKRMLQEPRVGIVSSLCFSRDGSTLAGGTYGNEVKLWDVHTGELQQTCKAAATDASVDAATEHNVVKAVTYTPEGKTLAVSIGGYHGGPMQLWDVHTGQVLRTWPKNIYQADVHQTSVTFSPNGATLVIAPGDGTGNGELALWNL